MGLLSFVKDAGAALFGSKEEEKQVEAELQAKVEAQREKLEKLKAARALENKVKALGLGIEEAAITVEDGVVTVAGKVETQEIAEKIVLTMGNVEGISSVDNQLEVTNPEPEAVFHTVERGDTLSKIAKEHYGNASKYHAIFEANKPMLTDPDKIYPGQVLRIPALDG